MKNVKINGKEATIKMSMLTFRRFGESLGADTFTSVYNLLQEMKPNQDDGLSMKGLDVFANLLYEMAKAGKSKDIDLEDCYESVFDVDLMIDVMNLLTSWIPNEELLKKKAEEVKST